MACEWGGREVWREGRKGRRKELTDANLRQSSEVIIKVKQKYLFARQ